MNLKPIFFFTLCLQLLKTGYAQVTANLTADFKLHFATSEIIALDDNKFIQYVKIIPNRKFVTHGLEVIQLDNKGNVVHKTAIQKGEIIAFETLGLKKVGDKIFLLYKPWDEKTENRVITAVEIDPKTLSAGPPKIIGSPEKADKKFLGRDIIISLYSSPDHQYNLLFADIENEYFFSVLDNNLEMRWYKTGLISEDRYARIQSVTIDNSGTVFVGYKTLADKRSDIASLNHVVAFTQKKEKDIPILLGDETLVNNINLLLSSDGNSLYVAGGYYEGVKNFRKSMGFYNAAINCSTFAFDQKFEKHPFPDTFITQMADDSWGSSKGIEAGYKSQLFEMDDGSLDLVCGYVPNDAANIGHTTPYAGPMFNIRLSKEGIFFSRVPRFRISAAPVVTKFGNHVGSWYYAKAYKNKIFIFYNDHPKNLLQPIDQKVDRSDVYTTHVVAAAIIEANGQVQRKILLDMSEEHFIAIPEDIIELSDSLLLAPIQKVKMGGSVDNEYKWLILSLIKDNYALPPPYLLKGDGVFLCNTSPSPYLF